MTLNADGAAEETLEFASTIMPTLTTGSNTFDNADLVAGDW